MKMQFEIEVPEALHGMDVTELLQNMINGVDIIALQDVVDFIINYSDVFGYDYIGYWACGLKRYDDKGWLMLTDTEDQDIDCDAVIKTYEDNGTLIEGSFFLGKKEALQAAIKLRDIGDWDANDIDVAIQKVVFNGEVVYG